MGIYIAERSADLASPSRCHPSANSLRTVRLNSLTTVRLNSLTTVRLNSLTTRLNSQAIGGGSSYK